MRWMFTALCIAAIAALPPATIVPSAIAADPRTDTHDISGVTRIAVSGPAMLSITFGAPETLQITAVPEDFDRIEVDRADDTLEVGFDGGRIFHRDPEHEIRYDITVAALEDLELDGAIRATIDGVIGDRLTLAISGSSVTTVSDLTFSALTAAVSGASSLEIAGTTNTLNLDVSGASSYRGSELESRVATVAVSGASRAVVRGTDVLVLEASGASVIDYAAPPEAVVTQNRSGAAMIRDIPFTIAPAPLAPATPTPAHSS